MSANRNQMVDTLRTLGAFSVIILHANYGKLDGDAVQALRLCARWAVPFFFLVSGYFFEKKSKVNLDNAFIGTLRHLVIIYAIVNVVYFFVALKTNFYTLGDILSIRSIVLGDFYHLWFVGSMIFAYILLWIILSLKLDKLLLVVAIFTVIFILLIGPYESLLKSGIETYFSRFLLSIPFLFTGFLYSRYKLEHKFGKIVGLSVLIIGVLFQFVESFALYSVNRSNLFEHEFLFGTFLISVGAFMFALNYGASKGGLLAEIGRDYSFLIYLYHPIVIVGVFFVIKKLGIQNTYYSTWFNPISIFTVTLLSLRLIAKKYPTLFSLMSGRV